MLKHVEERQRTLEQVGAIEHTDIIKLKSLMNELSRKFNTDQKELVSILKKRGRYASVPLKLFNNILSPLENVVMYLHIKLGFNQTDVAKMLNRDHTTIWTTLEKALTKITKSKYLQLISKIKEEYLIPIQIFENRKLSILEHVSIYIKDKYSLSYHEIAILMGKNDRTIWTVVNRARKK